MFLKKIVDLVIGYCFVVVSFCRVSAVGVAVLTGACSVGLVDRAGVVSLSADVLELEEHEAKPAHNNNAKLYLTRFFIVMSS
jgi:hypothetical protein